jgi:hypothetical protein
MAADSERDREVTSRHFTTFSNLVSVVTQNHFQNILCAKIEGIRSINIKRGCGGEAERVKGD